MFKCISYALLDDNLKRFLPETFLQNSINSFFICRAKVLYFVMKKKFSSIKSSMTGLSKGHFLCF
jgi:hypothetical protein